MPKTKQEENIGFNPRVKISLEFNLTRMQTIVESIKLQKRQPPHAGAHRGQKNITFHLSWVKVAKTDRLRWLQDTKCFIRSMGSFKTQNQPSVLTVTSTGTAARVPSPSLSVTAVPTQKSTGFGDKEATLSSSTLVPSSSISTDREKAATTEGHPGFTANETATPKGLTSKTDSITERFTTQRESDALSLPSSTIVDPVTAPTKSLSPEALTAPRAPEQRIDGRSTTGNTTVVTKKRQQWIRNRPHEQFKVGNRHLF